MFPRPVKNLGASNMDIYMIKLKFIDPEKSSSAFFFKQEDLTILFFFIIIQLIYAVGKKERLTFFLTC